MEVAKFAQHAKYWWDTSGPLKTLHDINPARLELIQQYIHFPGCRLLDVGCGGGILAESMAKRGALVTGLDVEPDALACAREHALQASVTLDYVCQPLELYEAELFDAISCMEMLEHVPNPPLIIEHCARLLKPEGYLFLSTLNRTLKAYATAIIGAEYLLNVLPRQTHDYDKFIKPSELASMVRACGLEVINLSGLSYNPLTSIAKLYHSVDVNYLMVCQKRAL